ncbi:MAG: hypothetical protein RRB13_10300 [bacterium]|nr:hypothetical protein [bacterium]
MGPNWTLGFRVRAGLEHSNYFESGWRQLIKISSKTSEDRASLALALHIDYQQRQLVYSSPASSSLKLEGLPTKLSRRGDQYLISYQADQCLLALYLNGESLGQVEQCHPNWPLDPELILGGVPRGWAQVGAYGPVAFWDRSLSPEEAMLWAHGIDGAFKSARRLGFAATLVFYLAWAGLLAWWLRHNLVMRGLVLDTWTWILSLALPMPDQAIQNWVRSLGLDPRGMSEDEIIRAIIPDPSLDWPSRRAEFWKQYREARRR